MKAITAAPIRVTVEPGRVIGHGVVDDTLWAWRFLAHGDCWSLTVGNHAWAAYGWWGAPHSGEAGDMPEATALAIIAEALRRFELRGWAAPVDYLKDTHTAEEE